VHSEFIHVCSSSPLLHYSDYRYKHQKSLLRITIRSGNLFRILYNLGNQILPIDRVLQYQNGCQFGKYPFADLDLIDLSCMRCRYDHFHFPIISLKTRIDLHCWKNSKWITFLNNRSNMYSHLNDDTTHWSTNLSRIIRIRFRSRDVLGGYVRILHGKKYQHACHR
jgi:hypothetical protein